MKRKRFSELTPKEQEALNENEKDYYGLTLDGVMTPKHLDPILEGIKSRLAYLEDQIPEPRIKQLRKFIKQALRYLSEII